MKFMLLVRHDETAFDELSEATKRNMLAESVQLTHQLHEKGQYVSASQHFQIFSRAESADATGWLFLARSLGHGHRQEAGKSLANGDLAPGGLQMSISPSLVRQ